MISKQQLHLINRKTLKYPLDIAEKDYPPGVGSEADE